MHQQTWFSGKLINACPEHSPLSEAVQWSLPCDILRDSPCEFLGVLIWKDPCKLLSGCVHLSFLSPFMGHKSYAGVHRA